MGKRLDPDVVISEIDTSELLRLADQLVAVPSVGRDVKAVMELAETYLRSHGVPVEIWAREPERPNVVATIGQGRPLLAINGHLDTVPISDRSSWATNPFAGAVVDDRLYGLGALDMKGPCAVMLLTMAKLSKYVGQLAGTLQLQVVCDEEEGAGYGTIFLAEQMRAGKLPRPDMVIMGEFSNLRILHAERGTLKFEVTFFGRSTHTMTARVEGINPIVHAARAVQVLDRPLSDFDPQIGYGIISVNGIGAGRFPSQVPAECKILVDRRMLPGESDESCLAQAERDIIEALRDYPDARFEISHLLDQDGRPRYSPPNATPWDSPVVQIVARAHEKVTGQPAEPFVDWYGATDGRLFRLAGIDTVNYGPRGAHAHGANEFVELTSLETQARVFMTAILDLLA